MADSYRYGVTVKSPYGPTVEYQFEGPSADRATDWALDEYDADYSVSDDDSQQPTASVSQLDLKWFEVTVSGDEVGVVTVKAGDAEQAANFVASGDYKDFDVPFIESQVRAGITIVSVQGIPNR